ncbi:MAG: TraM recognition domain-containing protein [Singulisphaera sp.]
MRPIPELPRRPYAVGLLALLVAERSEFAPFSGAIAVSTFLAAVLALDPPRRPPVRPGRPLRAVDPGRGSGPRHVVQLQPARDPGRGRLPLPDPVDAEPPLPISRRLRLVRLLRIAILSAASLTPAAVARDSDDRGGRRGPILGRSPRSPRNSRPTSDAWSSSRPRSGLVTWTGLERRRDDASRARAARLSVSHLAPTAWLISSALSILLCVLGPPSAFFLVFWFIAGRLLTAYHDALEAPDASEQSLTKSVWDNRVERILDSKDTLEREHLYIGRSYYNDYPVLLHLDLLRAHAHILGDTGSRKTSIGIAPTLTQLIAREDSSVVIFDLKGDMALFECARAEAEAAGVPFKWFTNATGDASYVFNPFAQSHMDQVSVNQRTQGILQALSLEFGEGYGEAYFSAMHEIVLSTYLRTYRDIASFKDLYCYLKDKNAYRGIGDLNDWEKARHLMTLANKLADVYPLNLKPSDLPGRPEVFEKQIDMPSLLRKKQVVYFYLVSVLEPTTVSPVAKLAMSALLTASARRGKGDNNRVYVFLDEFQRVISEDIKIFLEQARSKKVHLILANQTAGQLESSGTDLTDTVDSCTAYKQSFKATDLKSLKKLEDSSGEALYHSADWDEAINAGLDEASDAAFDIGHMPTGLFDSPEVKVKETEGPRLERNTIIELSAKPMASFVRFTEGSGYTQFSGYYLPIISDFHISMDEFVRRSDAGWPEPDAGTVVGRPDDGGPSGETPFVTGPPSGPPPPANVPDDFALHLEQRLTGPVPPRIERPGKGPKSPPTSPEPRP